MSRLRWMWLLPVLGMAGCEPFTAWFDYAADDPKLQYVGRMDFSVPNDPTEPQGPRYAFPGTTVRFRCNCTGVDVAFKDLGTGDAQNTINFVNVIVDGKTEATVELKRGDPQILKGARNLMKGEHTIEIVKRTDSAAGTVQFIGVSLQGIMLDPPPPPEKRLEFIGDSVTCGYGNELRIDDPKYIGYRSKNQDISKAYGSLLGRRFNAEVFHTCLQGRGIYRDTAGDTNQALPPFYPRLFPDADDSPRWDFEQFVPDVIVINLGLNDFSTPDESGLPTAPSDPQAFKDAYAAFIRELFMYYQTNPNLQIVCAVGPMLNDFYPEKRAHWTRIQQYVSEMVEEVRAAGYTNVHYFA
ncbi:MAG TPA: GDSL-type esterase/lipase family protein, partial [Archangium sp.]|uniref:SGNH/GDSL hydrolase family protein n=1 Tax=Archangium sp. TaxID=1872627 RepID=UPI002ED85044